MSVKPKLLDEVLELPIGQRIELVEKLLLSLEDEPFDEDAEALWEAELEARAAAIDNGTARHDPADVVLARMRERLKPHKADAT